MTDALVDLLRKATAAIGTHSPELAAGDRCNCLTCRTGRLAARGWPTTTAGDGSGVRSTTTSSPVERAAGGADPLNALDDRLSIHVAVVRTELAAIIGIAAVVDSHATTDDVVPPGTGECRCGCGRSCDPRRRGAEDRLKAGLHPSCHRRWLRWRNEYPGVTISDFLDACYLERGETRAKPVAPPLEPAHADRVSPPG